MCAKLSFIAGNNYDNETAIDGGFIYSAGPENIGVNLLSDAFSEYIGKNNWIRSIERVQLLDSSYGIFK